jgi:hypothetical protein
MVRFKITDGTELSNINVLQVLCGIVHLIHTTLSVNQHVVRYTMYAERNGNGTDTQGPVNLQDGLNCLTILSLCNFVYVCWFSKSGFKSIFEKLQGKRYRPSIKLQVGSELPHMCMSLTVPDLLN